MRFELTHEQSESIAAGPELAVAVIDPQSQRAYRLIPEEMYKRLENLLYDDSPSNSQETAAMAGAAFGMLDDTDYSHYLADAR